MLSGCWESNPTFTIFSSKIPGNTDWHSRCLFCSGHWELNPIFTNSSSEFPGNADWHSRREINRDAENRTRPSRTRSVRTTDILHPDLFLDPKACVLPIYYNPKISNGANARVAAALHPKKNLNPKCAHTPSTSYFT